MSNEVFINYWIGQEPNPPSPTLNQMPGYVNIVPLAFVTIDENYNLDFSFLTQHFSASEIQGWIQTVKANGTKVLFSINSQRLGSVPQNQQQAFVQQTVAAMSEWGVDGIDFDYEPPQENNTLISLIQALRAASPEGSVFTAPIYFPWIYQPTLLSQLAGVVDYISTMDYTPYPGYDETISLLEQYAGIMGGWSKLVVGMSCMGPSNSGNFTPLDDVKKLSAYEPSSSETKGGCMLYTFSYDVESRSGSGTGYPDGTWTETIHENMP